ncbi:MAG: GlsB/YeaQ/YmgE family stress response membrane protein [Neisseriaceae bacterium]
MNLTSVVIWIVFGLVVGVVARFLMPGKAQGAGYLVTIALGIIGSFLGGWIGNQLGWGGVNAGFNLYSFVMALIGSVILLFIYGLVTKKQ